VEGAEVGAEIVKVHCLLVVEGLQKEAVEEQQVVEARKMMAGEGLQMEEVVLEKTDLRVCASQAERAVSCQSVVEDPS
jgi:hypothetical protein